MDEFFANVESGLFPTQESIGGIKDILTAAVGSPVKYTKIKNNIKKLVQTRIEVALVELDFQKKKEKSDNKETTDKLKEIVKIKKAAITDKLGAINDRITSLATTDALKAIASLGKIKARMEASEKLLKAASAEESKVLKVKLVKWKKDEAEIIKNYQSTSPKKEEEPVEDVPDPSTPDKSETDLDDVAKIEGLIQDWNKQIEAARTQITKNETELETAAKEKVNATDPATFDERIQKLKKDIEDDKEDITELKKKEMEAKKSLNPKESILQERLDHIGRMLDDPASSYNKTPSANRKVLEYLARWQAQMSTSDVNTYNNVMDSIMIEMEVVDKEVFALNTKEIETPAIAEAKQMAAKIQPPSGDPGSMSTDIADKMRAAMARM